MVSTPFEDYKQPPFAVQGLGIFRAMTARV